MNKISDRDYVNSLARGLEVIRVFTRHKPKMTLSDVSRTTGMTRARVRRFLLTLVREGYVESDGKLFWLRPKTLELGFSVLSSMNLLDAAQPIMNRLTDKMKESCFAAVLDKDSVIYIARASSNRVIDVDIHVGSRVPAHCVSTGRVLLAALPDEQMNEYLENATLEKLTEYTVTSKVELRSLLEETRRQGWSIVNQELELGLMSISVPIRTQSGDIIAALNLSGPTSRTTMEELRTRYLGELLEASQKITMCLTA